MHEPEDDEERSDDASPDGTNSGKFDERFSAVHEDHMYAIDPSNRR